MKKHLLCLAGLLALAGCEKVPPGYVGIMVNTLGTDKGVEKDVLDVGRYYTGWGKELYTFPVFQQTYNWTAENHEAITFQSSDGVVISGDFAITYQIDPKRVPIVFQTYRRGVDEITNGPLRNAVRDALQKYSSSMTSEQVYASKKTELLNDVTNSVKNQVGPLGIEIDSISAISNFTLPDAIVTSINNKIIANQNAEAKRNEVATEQAQQDINRVKAEGQAAADVARANGTAQANKIVAQSLTPELVQYDLIQKWDGVMPQVTSGGGISTLINIPDRKASTTPAQ